MAKLRGNSLKKVGRCHPWCGNMEYGTSRAAEKRAWEGWLDEYEDSHLTRTREGVQDDLM